MHNLVALAHTVPWVHTIPACLAVGFGCLCLKSRCVSLKIVWGILWFLFLPNTAYIFIDVERLIRHWNSDSTAMSIAVLCQYVLLEMIGLATFLLAFLPFEHIIRTKHLSQTRQIAAVVALNVFVALGIAIGRVGYTNSYVVLTAPTRVVLPLLLIVTSLSLPGVTAMLAIFCSGLYLLFRRTLLRHIRLDSASYHAPSMEWTSERDPRESRVP